MNATVHPLPSTATAIPVAAIMDSPATVPDVPPAEPELVCKAPSVVTCCAHLEATDLCRIVSTIARITERRNTIPILACAYFTAVNGGIMIETTDLDVVMRVIVPGKAEPGFKTALPVHKLAELLKKVDPSSGVKMAVVRTASERIGEQWVGSTMKKTIVRSTEESVQLYIGSLRLKLVGNDPADWPVTDLAPPKHYFILPTADALRGFGRTEMAISTEETRYYLNGTYVHVPTHSKLRPATLCFVATDGHRLAKVELPAPEGATMAMPGAIVPRKIVGELIRLCKAKGAPDTVSVAYVTEQIIDGKRTPCTRMVFHVGDIAVITKLIDGTFPDYGRVIPTGNDRCMRANIQELIRAIKQVAVVSSERGRTVRLSLVNDFVRLDCNNPDLGRAEFTIGVDYDGAPLDIGFNSEYLVDILAALGGDTVEFLLADPGSPALIRGTDADEKGVGYVLMPMRV